MAWYTDLFEIINTLQTVESQYGKIWLWFVVSLIILLGSLYIQKRWLELPEEDMKNSKGIICFGLFFSGLALLALIPQYKASRIFSAIAGLLGVFNWLYLAWKLILSRIFCWILNEITNHLEKKKKNSTKKREK